jgi:crossover junction endodeoxyribonuclease RuvC
MYYMGIDPGFSGAIAVLDKDLALIHSQDMPIVTVGKKRELDEAALFKVCYRYSPTYEHLVVGIEKSQTMPGQGIASSGRYMASYGFLRGLCVGMGLSYVLIRPPTWKKVMLMDMPKEKGSSIVKVNQLYPDLQLTRKKDHGIADAILIARYTASTYNVS